MKDTMRKIILLALTLLVIDLGSAYAQTEDELLKELGISTEEDKVAYKFPDIATKASLYLGYRFTDLGDSEKAFEFEHKDDFPVGGADLRWFKYPHRLHADIMINSKEDYQADINYAYGETFISRWFRSVFYHNLDNIELNDPDPGSGNYEVSIGDRNEEYGVTAGIENFIIRLKYPNFPAHLYVKGSNVNREGNYQQRYLTGSGYFQNLDRSTRERSIDWNTLEYTIGGNSHLGHAEVDLSHTEKRFDVDDGEVMFDTYDASAYRQAGTYPHNRVPELKSSSNTFKIHTNYTESLVASATFTVKESENSTSDAKADIFMGSGSLQWTPLPRLSFFADYYHSDIDADNPGTTSIKDIQGQVKTYTQPVKASISKKTDAVSVTGRYNPEPGVTLKAKYSYENVERDNAEDWDLEESTRKNALSLSADLRIVKGLYVKGEYVHEAVDCPSYNTEPDFSDEGIASVSWTPIPGISLLANYSIGKQERDDLYFPGAENAVDRVVRTDNLLGSGTFQLMNNLSLTTSYAMIKYRVKQDIVYHSPAEEPMMDSMVPYKDTAHVYSAALYYIPVDRLSVNAMVTHTKSSGEFSPDSEDLLQPVSVAEFSEQDITETEYELSGTYHFGKGYLGDVEFRYRDVSDEIDNIYDSNESGDAYILIFRINKEWN